MSIPFLLEIGTEEIPDWMIRPALEQMRELFGAILAEQRLGGQVSWTEATPRRLALRADGLSESQPDEVRETSGPPVTAAAGAVAGFAKKLGVTVDDLKKTSTGRGEYWTYSKNVPGRRSTDVLAEALPELIGKISWPKTMYWTGKGGQRFIRPVRWLVALLGDQVVPFQFAGVSSGSTTNGHRLLGSARFSVTVGTYEEDLRRNGVILRAAERKAEIEKGLGADVQRDDALLETLVYLTERPSTIRGAFDPSYLELPGEILTTVMRHHQRYFSVTQGDGLAPEFVAVMNTGADPDGLVRKGNERVLRARFNDARFFWDTDLRRRLEDRIEDLKHVTFQAKLGSYFEKTERNVALARKLAAQVGVDAELCARAALLAKCDLPTEMVKEFTELQGVVGGLYARQQGEPEEVWKAVYDHYKPASMEDTIPSTLTGKVVALADKLDTLRGCFAIGLVPTGSRDPFALRRAAQGVIKIVVEGKLRLKLEADEQLRSFLLDRVRYYFREVRGFKYDEVNAVLAAGSDDLVDVEERLNAIQEVRPTEDFEPVAASFKRIANILKQAQWTGGGSVDPALVEPGPEAELVGAVDAARARMSSGYRESLEAIASIRPALDKFFDKVLVNAPDERLRRNRLAFLGSLLSEFSTIADFSEIVVTGNSQ